jgi:hypothetical protein
MDEIINEENNNEEHLEIRLGPTRFSAMIGGDNPNYYINQVHNDGSYRPVGRIITQDIKLRKTDKKALFYKINIVDFHSATGKYKPNFYRITKSLNYFSRFALTEEKADKIAHITALAFADRIKSFYESDEIIDRRQEDLEKIITGLKMHSPDCESKIKFYQK